MFANVGAGDNELARGRSLILSHVSLLGEIAVLHKRKTVVVVVVAKTTAANLEFRVDGRRFRSAIPLNHRLCQGTMFHRDPTYFVAAVSFYFDV